MKTKVQSKLVVNLTKDEYQQCYRLNFGPGGSMMYDLSYHKNDVPYSKARVIRICDDEGKLLAWALLQPREINDLKKGYLVYFYTRATHRRRGLGKRLMRQVQKYDPKPEVCPHDSRSGGFFRNYVGRIKYEDYKETWLRADGNN